MRRMMALITATWLVAGSAHAATTQRELQLIARAVGFLQGVPRGVVDVAIVEGPGADAVMRAMGQTMSAGGVTLLPRRVAASDLVSSGVRVIIVPEGQTQTHPAVAAAAQRLGAVTLSTDMACVRAGHCVVGVAATPRVDIVISRAAARLNRVSFAQAFRVVFREI